MAKGTSRRQNNGSAFFPQWMWDHIECENGEEIEFQDDTGRHGNFISFWKKGN